MKIDRRMVILFLPPLAACLICVLASALIPRPVLRAPARPDFLNTIDHLSMVTTQPPRNTTVTLVKDVFRHEWKVPEDAIAAPEPAVDVPIQPMTEPVRVTMIVQDDEQSFCIVDGRKMRTGDATERFRVLSIARDHVIIQYNNGTRETYHVKPY